MEQQMQIEGQKHEQPATNWAGNVTFQARKFFAPHSIEEIQDLVRGPDRIKVVGGGHSFSEIANTDGIHLSLKNFGRIQIDPDKSTAAVGAGVTYGELAEHIHRAGFAVHNMASLPHISIAGACATATHGSGMAHGNLATAVSGLTMVTADGSVLKLTREDPRFNGAVVGLGALGVVTEVVLDLRSAFDLKQLVYEGVPFSRIRESLRRILGSGYSVSIFTDWESEQENQVWVKGPCREDSSDHALLGAPATANRHPLKGLPAECCTPQMGVAGPWYDRLPHFRIGFTPSAGAELQSEFFVPTSSAPAAIEALRSVRSGFSHVVQVTELRAVARDWLWMSPQFGHDTVGIHFTWQKREAEVLEALRTAVEPALKPFHAIPHWGKVFTTLERNPESVEMRNFSALARELGGLEKFENHFLAAVLP